MNNKHCIFKFLKYLSDWYNQCVAGALSIFSMQGCVPDIRRHGNVSRNTPVLSHIRQSLGPNTLPRVQEVYHVLDDMIFEDHAIQYHPCCQLISRNTSLQCGEY